MADGSAHPATVRSVRPTVNGSTHPITGCPFHVCSWRLVTPTVIHGGPLPTVLARRGTSTTCEQFVDTSPSVWIPPAGTGGSTHPTATAENLEDYHLQAWSVLLWLPSRLVNLLLAY